MICCTNTVDLSDLQVFGFQGTCKKWIERTKTKTTPTPKLEWSVSEQYPGLKHAHQREFSREEAMFEEDVMMRLVNVIRMKLSWSKECK